MRINIWVAVLAAFPVSLHAYVIVAEETTQDVVDTLQVAPRALPNSPKGYTPSYVNCPDTRPSVRSASSLSDEEKSWLQRRRTNTIPAMRTLLERLDIPDFDVGSYFQAHSNNASALPNIGIAMSGGGWRALQNGAGALQAFDSRTQHSTDKGHLGGLLQSATYLGGLSGGGWLVGSLFMNNFSTVTALRDSPSGDVWQFDNSILKGPDDGGLQVLDTFDYWLTMADEITAKEDAGFDITITDLWGRALSFQLIDATNGGPSYTWSSIALSQGFQNGDTPFPMLVSDERAPGETLIPSTTTVYEFNPFEMGSWDPTSYGFIPTQYLGSNFTKGNIPSNDKCVVGFDNAGFIMGTSSSLFNQIILSLDVSEVPHILINLINRLLSSIGGNNEDIADYTPNPFFHYNPHTNPSAQSDTLHLVDGGEDLQNLPLHPLIQPLRNVDVIFAVDSSADTTYHWPNGTALVATYQRNQPGVSVANGTRFPSIPDENTMVNLGLNSRPTFFGCDAANITSAHPVPLLVYIPNHPYSAYSNVSTFDLAYPDAQRDAIILNGYDVATMANGTLAGHEDWPVCVACAVLKRSFGRTRTVVPQACQQCFDKYCWDGKLNSTRPVEYEPKLLL